MTLTDGERRSLIALASAVGISPRRAKRFANLYRLLKASLSPVERRGFVLENGRDGSFGTAMALLAATTGAPITARRMLTALGELPAAEQKSDDPIGAFLDNIAVQREERRTWTSIRAALPQRPYTDAELTELRFWAPRIYRFCFNDFDYDGEQQSERVRGSAMVAPLRQ